MASARCEADAVAVPARDVSERTREKRLAHADGAEDHDVSMGLEEAKARELGEHALVEGDLRGLVPLLEAHRRIERGLARAMIGGRRLAA